MEGRDLVTAAVLRLKNADKNPNDAVIAFLSRVGIDGVDANNVIRSMVQSAADISSEYESNVLSGQELHALTAFAMGVATGMEIEARIGAS